MHEPLSQCLMFDFEKLVVYAKAKNFNSGVRKYLTECIAIFDVLRDEGEMDVVMNKDFHHQGEELSKILFRMIQNLNN